MRKQPAGPGDREPKLSIAIEYVGVIAIACLFIGLTVGWWLGRTQGGKTAGRVSAAGSEAGSETTEPALARIDRETNYDALVQIGNHAYDSGHPEIAIPAYEKALAVRPGDPNVMTDLGTMYLHTQQVERAADIFRRAAALDKNHPQSRYNLGVALEQMGDKEAAREAFQEVIRMDAGGQLARDAEKQMARLDKK